MARFWNLDYQGSGSGGAREHVTEFCTTDGTGGPRAAALYAGAGAAA